MHSIRVRKDNKTYIDWTRSKVMVVTAGLLGAFMGIISGVGLLTYLQYPYCNAVDVMPFLVIVAISITFVYQLTFLLGVLALTLRAEEQNMHNVFLWRRTIDVNTIDTQRVNIIEQLCCLGSHTRVSKIKPHTAAIVTNLATTTQNHTEQKREETWINNTIRLYYAPFLMKFEVKLITCLLYIIYLAAALYGCSVTQLGLEPIKLLVEDSYTIKYYQAMEEYYWKIGSQAQIVFGNAGNMSDTSNRNRIVEIVNEFSTTPHGMGPDNVDFWLNNFNRMLYNDKGSITSTDFYGDLEFFLSIEEHAQYRNDIHWENDTQIRLITAFRAMISLKNISTSVDQMAAADELRYLTSKYPEYNISTFHVLWRYVDQYQAVLPNTIQEVCSGVTFMILVALLLIPSATCSLWVILAILSIDAGIVGFMTFWGINLDTISMMTIVMSIGFSVDFTAHIAHSYVVVQAEDNNDRMTKVLCSLVKPISEGALATM
uniref:SSD domain-containing protein n=1 Tax=Romanomermis culicivorax TaxID=13658 RepID=A0A915IBS3_ROMCU